MADCRLAIEADCHDRLSIPINVTDLPIIDRFRLSWPIADSDWRDWFTDCRSILIVVTDCWFRLTWLVYRLSIDSDYRDQLPIADCDCRDRLSIPIDVTDWLIPIIDRFRLSRTNVMHMRPVFEARYDVYSARIYGLMWCIWGLCVKAHWDAFEGQAVEPIVMYVTPIVMCITLLSEAHVVVYLTVVEVDCRCRTIDTDYEYVTMHHDICSYTSSACLLWDVVDHYICH